MDKNEVVSITSVSKSLTEQQSKRASRYFYSMMVRTLCFLLAVLTPSPFRWLFIFLAVVLPYFAVVIANAGRESVVKVNDNTLAKLKELN